VNFTGKTAIVTGAARGIGRSICLELARYGCNIAFNYSKSSAEAQKLVSELKTMGREVHCIQARAEDLEAVEQMAEDVGSRFGSIDYLVNNAGIARDRLILRMSEEEWDSVIDTNLKGAFNFCKAVAPFMVKARFGSILNITSVSGLRGSPGQVNYSASKAGLIGLTKALARELAGRNITVNSLALGLIETDMTHGLSDDYRAAALKEIPAGRFGSAGEIARIAAFLLSDDSRYITGQVIQADGGLAM
jgi:3-oxoacyl-[acyl-carrier protein] reductase